MPRGLRNWNYKDVIKFLKENGFTFYEERDGSHEAWVKSVAEKEAYVVEVNFIKGAKAYPPKTLETMIRQSGIEKKKWRGT